MVYKNSGDFSCVQKERRRELRVPLRVIRVKIETNTDVFFGYAKNISAGGLFISTVNPKGVGEKFKLKITLPNSKKEIVVMAEVVWSRKFSESKEYEPGMGIKYIEITDEDAELIRQFVNSEKKEK